MKQLIHSVLIFLVLSGTCYPVWGQQPDQPPSGEIEDAQVIIEKDKPLTLPKANRFYQKTEIRPVVADSVDLTYQITQPDFRLDPFQSALSPKPFQPAAGSAGGFRNYVKAGFGNYNAPLLNVFAGFSQEQSSAGIWLNHESFASGPVRQEESAYGSTEAILSGSHRTGKVELAPRLYYQREKYFLYGYDQEAYLGSLTPDEEALELDRKALLNHVLLNAKIATIETDRIHAQVTPFLGYTTMHLKGEDPFNTELNPGIDGRLEMTLNEIFHAGVKTGFGHFDYESGITLRRSIFSVNPWVSWQADKLYIRGGLAVYSGTDSLNKEGNQYLYPDLEARFQLTNSIGLFATVGGDLQPVTLNSLRLSNRYLEDSLLLLNENKKFNVRAGITTSLTEKFQVEAFVRYGQTRNKALFMHSPSDTSRFNLVYDPGNFGEGAIGISGKYLIGTVTSVSATMTYLTYDPDGISDAWYQPGVRLELWAMHRIADKLEVTANFLLLDGITAPNPVTMDPVKMKHIADLGLGFQYDFTTRASAFLEFQNLLAQNYERYLNYPSRGLMIKLGFIYRF